MSDDNIDVLEPNLYEEYFPCSEIPRIKMNSKVLLVNLPDEIWITDTTFRDGQQSMSPFTVKQIVAIYDYLHHIDNHTGTIRQSEFFLYTERDREAVTKCLERGYDFPEITSWIRANNKDFELVKGMGIKETGMQPIYNSFDTKHILGRPVVVKINQTSGLAGIAAWMNATYNIDETNKIQKKDPRVKAIKHWIDTQYNNGRNTDISSEELMKLVNQYFE